MVRFVGATIGIAGILSLGALFIGFSDTGVIDVNGRISSTDQSGFATKVNTTNPSDAPNGGLRPVSDDPDAPAAPEAPQAAPVPEVSGASTTDATTTPESSEAENGEPIPSEGATPAEGGEQQ